MKFSVFILSLFSAFIFSIMPASALNFGKNTSQWAHDGECDDPRFQGTGMADVLLDEDTFADASDCKALYQKGLIVLKGSGSQKQDVFGDNSSQWANDGECDDPRFYGSGVDEILLDEDRAHDANDCRALFQSGAINWR